MIHLKKTIKKRMVIVLVSIIILIIMFTQLEKFNSWFFVHGPEELQGLFNSFGILSPIIFVLLYIVGNMFLVPSIPFTFTAGIVYGLFFGILLSIAGEIGAATINFYIGRKIKRKFFIHNIRS